MKNQRKYLIKKCAAALIGFITGFSHANPSEAARLSSGPKQLPIKLERKTQYVPITGNRLACMDQFDRDFTRLMKRWDIPGASVAIMRKGKLVYARGFGYADLSTGKKVEPASLFRVGSVSKIITAVATLKLVEEGKLSLDEKAVPLLQVPIDPRYAHHRDSRLDKITIRHLLQCSAGWDRSNCGDPMFAPFAQLAATEYSPTLRPTALSIIRYQFNRPLSFEPGTRFCYSNLAYSILGEIISKTSGKKYSKFVQEDLLPPMGINKIVPGNTLRKATNEVSYYGFPGEELAPSILPNLIGCVPKEYGGDFYLEALTADCGWVASSVDIARFVDTVFGDSPTNKQPLSNRMRKRMLTRPSIPEWNGMDSYFAMGWEVESAKLHHVKKEGCLPGSTAVVFHRPDGTSISLSMNSRPQLANIMQEETYALVEQAWKAISRTPH